jgi:hypothetical protein
MVLRGSRAWLSERRGNRGGFGPFGRRERLHRQSVDLLAHSIAQRLIDALMSGHAVGAFKLGRDDGGKKVAPVALDLDMLTHESVSDETLDFVGGGIRHDAVILAERRAAAEQEHSDTEERGEPNR